LHQWVKVAAIVTISFCLFMCLPPVHGASEQDASTALANANHALQSAFVTVLDAEKAGANVADLIGSLNRAGAVLASAQAAFDAGNYSEVVTLGASATASAEAVLEDASSLKVQATAQASNWWVTLFFSIAGSITFLCILFFAWRRFGRFYVRKLSDGRPEVGR
jgi:hypothetical protein